MVNGGRHTAIVKSLILALMLVFSGCTTIPEAELSDPIQDPWENFNRGMFEFNYKLDKAVLRPIAKGYNKITPGPLQTGIENFLSNLSYPKTIINLLLQGKPKQSAIGVGRFFINSTIGLVGFVDVASKADIPKHSEDFGQTLAKWGWQDSRYLMLPLLGPTTMRDGAGTRLVFGPDGYFDPINVLAREEDEYLPLIFSVLSTRARLLPQDSTLDEAFDPYILLRDAWLQQRAFKIYDGEPPLPDYDDYLFEDE